MIHIHKLIVVLDTTKVQIFKQITTEYGKNTKRQQLFQIPQRYRFSSKSQPNKCQTFALRSCFRYHKGTDFQANHNKYYDTICMEELFQIPQRYRFSSKSQPTLIAYLLKARCFRYHKGTDFQANHNVPAPTSVMYLLFQIPQRYRFSSKSQPVFVITTAVSGCFRYHKGTDFQANHNARSSLILSLMVVLDTTKVQIFKQITTT